MRKAAGIIMITLGVIPLSSFVVLFSLYDYLPVIGLPFGIFTIISTLFIIIGGVFCLKGRYWGLCLASALFAVFIAIVSLMGSSMGGFSSSNWVAWFLILGGIISMIFICATKREWQEIQG